MVFVRKVPGRSGTTKVQIAERRGGRDVVIEHVGTAHDGAELSVLMGVARRKMRPGQGVLGLDVDASEAIAPTREHLADAIHLTPAGEAKLAELFTEQVNEGLNR